MSYLRLRTNLKNGRCLFAFTAQRRKHVDAENLMLKVNALEPVGCIMYTTHNIGSVRAIIQIMLLE